LLFYKDHQHQEKSTFACRYFKPHNYEIINPDTFQTPAKCIQAAKDALDKGISVVVDNTNPSADVRSEYIALAKSHKIPCRCFVLNTPIELCHHLNYVRFFQTAGEVHPIPDDGYNTYETNYAAPKQSEGLDEIIDIDFTPKFDSESDEKMFYHYTDS